MKNDTNKTTERTDAQKRALQIAFEALEVFDHVLIVTSTHGDHEALGTDPEVCWKGGWPTASGLADLAKTKIGYSRRPRNEPR